MVSKWFGVNGSSSGTFMPGAAIGRLLTIASASHIRVRRDSSSNCDPCSSNRPLSAFRTVRIMRSHTPPAWLAVGVFSLNSNQSHSFFNKKFRTSSLSIFSRASFSSPLAPTKLVPWSDRSCLTGPLLAKKHRRTFINESVKPNGSNIELTVDKMPRRVKGLSCSVILNWNESDSIHHCVPKVLSIGRWSSVKFRFLRWGVLSSGATVSSTSLEFETNLWSRRPPSASISFALWINDTASGTVHHQRRSPF